MIQPDELIVDNFAGGGGASLGIEMALGRPVDIAVNHDAQAVAMHAANHPATKHYAQNIWRIDPREVCGKRPIGLAWFSPDCKHFSKAKGGKPVEKRIRDLAWVVVLWARLVKPRVIMLENVEEFANWGPLIETEDGHLKPCPLRRGLTFRRWVRELKREGYAVEWRELRACDYGAPTIRKRLFLIARFDGRPIVWPAATHGPGLIPYRTAAECIDWSIACPSIFTRKKPLADKTMARVAKGADRYVIRNPRPFIVPVTHAGGDRVHSIDEPLRTITTARRGEHALVVPYLVPRYGEREGQDPRSLPIAAPMPTVVPTGNGASLVAAFLAQHNGGMVGHSAEKPLSTIVGKGCTQQIVAAILSHQYSSNTCGGRGDPREPLKTVTTGGHHALVKAFMIKYYGTAVGQALDDPAHTLTQKARLGLVTVAGIDWQIIDIGMRMLIARELFRAQSFPDSYIIDPIYKGKPLTKTAQVSMCGNSVPPVMAKALCLVNLGAEMPIAGVAD